MAKKTFYVTVRCLGKGPHEVRHDIYCPKSYQINLTQWLKMIVPSFRLPLGSSPGSRIIWFQVVFERKCFQRELQCYCHGHRAQHRKGIRCGIKGRKHRIHHWYRSGLHRICRSIWWICRKRVAKVQREAQCTFKSVTILLAEDIVDVLICAL